MTADPSANAQHDNHDHHDNDKPSFVALVLAAGKGTRMKSARAKVLHAIAGRAMIHYPVRAAIEAGAARVVVVVGHGRDEVEAYLRKNFGDRVETVVQEEQRGTGHAVLISLPALSASSNKNAQRVMVLSGDTPLVDADALRALVQVGKTRPSAPLAMLTARLDDATGYGRIVRANGAIRGVKEHRDCSDEERKIQEYNPAIYMISLAFLREELPRLKPNNAQGELYLTDLVARAAESGGVCDGVIDAELSEGVNDRAQLSQLDARMLARIVRRHQVAGVTIRDAHSVEIHDGVEIGLDATIERSVVLRGATSIGAGARIDVGCVLTNMTVGEGVEIRPYTVATDSVIEAKAQIGPFSHVRPESAIGEGAHIGNFVEVKKTRLGKGSKANHLAYLGDGDVGEGVNIGAGTIFCNYDGFSKHVTKLEDGAFIGSDSQLVAPITVGKGAYVGTGTTVTRDVPAGALAVGRAKQENKEGYADRLRAKLKARKEASSK